MNTSQTIGSISALLPILVSGGVLYNAPILRYTNIFISGYRLYLRIAGYGLVACFGAAMLLPFLWAFLWKESSNMPYWQSVFFWLENRLFITALGGLVLATAVRYTILLLLERFIVNKIQRLKFWLLRRVTKNVGFEEQIVDAIVNKRLLMVTTEYGKVYVGRPVSDGGNYTASEEYRVLSLLPVASGYRDTETQEVRFTTDYLRVMKEKTFDSSLMQIAIPMACITQIRYFAKDMYDRFHAQRAQENAAE